MSRVEKDVVAPFNLLELDLLPLFNQHVESLVLQDIPRRRPLG